ncbi:MAG: hypothetical protein SGILL_010428 [Bacillariaceae sp.]
MKTIFTVLLLLRSTLGLLPSIIPTDKNTGWCVAFRTASGGQCPLHRTSRHLPLGAVAPAIVGDTPDLQTELNSEDLGLCHGILHASGVRSLSDLQALTEEQITDMGVDNFDRRNIRRVMEKLSSAVQKDSTLPTKTRELSTVVDGAFDTPKRFDAEDKQEFCLETISSENDVFKGRLFTQKQCRQLNRMAEYHAYRGIGSIGAGWTNVMYTLTAQHMLCKDIPGMVPTTKHIFSQLIQELYNLFPGRIRPGSICFESDGEPHLVKYNGRAKGTEAHTDNSEHVYITVNVALSADDEFTGGGTYITKLNTTVQLKQGEMLIHLGDLEHAGAEITSGVRRILIAFLACEWEEEALNQAKLENSRDYVPVVNDL